MSILTLKKFAACSTLLTLLAMPLPVSAGFGTGIGITFPASGSSGSRITNTYAALEFEALTQELTVEEKHGRLVLELKITNNGEVPYTIDHRNGQQYDFLIADKHGKKIWQWSEGMAFTQALCTTTIAPHQFEVYTAELDSKAYRQIKDQAVIVTAWLLNTPCRLSTKVPTHTAASSTPVLIHGGVIID